MNGRIFPRDKYLWIAYYHHGKEQREVARHVRTDAKIEASDPKGRHEAERFLKHRLGEVTAEKHGGPAFVSLHAQRLTVKDMLDSLESDFKTRKKDTPQFKSHLKHIRDYFGTWKAIDVSADSIKDYIEDMREREYADAAINRGTQLLEQAYALAIADKKLAAAPRITHLSETANVRKGFFETADFEAVVSHLPEYLKDFAWFGFWTGRRSGSIKKMCWTDIDVAEYVVRFRAENEKNRKADSVAIPEGPIREIIDRRKAAQPWEDEDGEIRFSQYVFHRDGLPVGDFRKAWKSACKKAGVERLFHDLRRTAARNLIAAGVPQVVAMKITGHKTDAVFRRYAIVAPEQAREALAKTQEHVVSTAASRKVVAMKAGK